MSLTYVDHRYLEIGHLARSLGQIVCLFSFIAKGIPLMLWFLKGLK